MAGRSQETNMGELKHDREMGADYYVGFSEQDFKGQEETNVPYKLEPNVMEIENFLTRLRQEGL